MVSAAITRVLSCKQQKVADLRRKRMCWKAVGELTEWPGARTTKLIKQAGRKGGAATEIQPVVKIEPAQATATLLLDLVNMDIASGITDTTCSGPYLPRSLHPCSSWNPDVAATNSVEFLQSDSNSKPQGCPDWLNLGHMPMPWLQAKLWEPTSGIQSFENRSQSQALSTPQTHKVENSLNMGKFRHL